MNNIFEEFEVTVDAKGRFMFPTKLRTLLPKDQADAFYIKHNKKCISIYTQSEWNNVIEKLNQLNELNATSAEYKSLFLAGAQEVVLDSSGRMSIKSHILKRVDISKDCMLKVMGTKAELWDMDSFIAEQDKLLDREQELSDKIYGEHSFFK